MCLLTFGNQYISIIVIIVIVIVTGIIRAFCLPGGLVKFFSVWGDRENCCVLACFEGGGGRVSNQADTLHISLNRVERNSQTCMT